MAPAMLVCARRPAELLLLLPAAGSVQLAPPPGLPALAPATALGFPSYLARRGCLWVAPGASRGHFSSLALSRMGPVYLAFFIFWTRAGAAGPGRGLGTPGLRGLARVG